MDKLTPAGERVLRGPDGRILVGRDHWPLRGRDGRALVNRQGQILSRSEEEEERRPMTARRGTKVVR
jgi:hypothetical protein